MMRRDFLLKVILLGFVLATVSAVIFVTARAGLSPATTGAAGTQTLFDRFVTSGGWIVWFILVPMSFVMVYLAVLYCLTIRPRMLVPETTGDEIVGMAQQLEPAQFVKGLAGREDFVSVAVSKAVSKGGADWFRMRDAFFESVQEQALRLGRRIEWINLIGNVSPMVGLFGTIVGMIELFNAIVIAGGQPQPAQLAGGISVALVTTFWGLLIAIPALTVYGIFRNRIEVLANLAVEQGENILPKIRRGFEKQKAAHPPKGEVSPLAKPMAEQPAAAQRQPIQQISGKPLQADRQPTTPT
jgi:biopolymer transport protein ExbB